MDHKLAVTIITFNEEKRIRECLKSVKWADEIIILDSFSTDRTRTICQEYTDKIYSKEWMGYGREKNLAAEKAQSPWILNLDADEIVTEELKLEISSLLKAAPSCAAYQISRKNYFGNYWVRHGGWYPDYTLRLYRREKAEFTESNVHESLKVRGSIGRLKKSILHYTYEDTSDYLNRLNKYSSLSALDLLNSGGKSSCFDLSLRPCFAFLKKFFLKFGFLDGVIGFHLAVLGSFYTYSKYAKLKELEG